MKKNIVQVQVFEDEDGYFVASCSDLSLVTQGKGLDELMHNLREVISLAIENENMSELGFTENPSVLVSIELPPVHT